jgi:hypothetical protein
MTSILNVICLLIVIVYVTPIKFSVSISVVMGGACKSVLVLVFCCCQGRVAWVKMALLDSSPSLRVCVCREKPANVECQAIALLSLIA